MTLPVQAGDQGIRAVERLEHLRPGLELIALRMLGAVDAAREAVQETLARAVAALANGQPSDPDKLPAFVAGIARHVAVDMLRADRRLVSLDTLPPADHPSNASDVLSALVSTAERTRVRDALSRLATADREVLRLCYFEGLTPAEIAVRFGEPAERVRKRKSRALERLRAAFHDPTPSHDGKRGSTELGGPA